MSRKIYKLSWAKIGNSSGYRLPSEFFKEYPEFVGTDGVIQMIAPNKALVSLTKSDDDQARDELLLKLYLDFLMEQALANPEELEEYTHQMAEADEVLMAGVELDAD